MTNISSPSTSVICEEVFDDGYQPSADEINDYALKIGIDPVKEPHLLYLAKEGLIQALPADWKICYNDQLQAHYYINTRTKASQWDHPLDSVYRDLAEQARQKQIGTPGLDNSDDVSQLDSGIRSLQGTDELDSNNTNDTSSPVSCNIKMNSLNGGGGGVSGFSGGVNKFLESRGKSFSSNAGFVGLKNSRFEVVKTNPQIGLAMRMNSNAEKKLEKGGFTLTGTGAMFLKSKTKINTLFDDNLHSNVKGILRDSSLTDMRRKCDETDASAAATGEDKKSVRFNLDDIRMQPNYSPEEDASSSRRFTQSPEVSDNSDDDNPWDLMDEDDPDQKRLNEIKVVAIPKPQPVKVLKPFVRSQSLAEEADKPNLVLNKLKEKNLVKPLYEDTDSDSRGSSVRSFIQKTSIKDDFDMQAEHDFYLGELKLKLQAEKEAEEKRLREEMQSELDEMRKEISKQNVSRLTEFKRKMEFRPEDMHEVEEELRREKQRRLSEENERFEILLQSEIDSIKENFNLKLLNIEKEYNARRLEVEEENRQKLDAYRSTIADGNSEQMRLIVSEHKSHMDTLQQNHAELLHELERDLKSEEEILKKEHALKLSDMRDKLSHELEMEKLRMRDTGDDRLYEKVRCEKRLLEDKYRCLKEKYVRLKTDVKMSLERRNRRREQAAAAQNTTTTGSETERSTSNKPSIGNSEIKSLSLSTPHSKPPIPPKSHLVEKAEKRKGLTSKYIKQLQVQYQDDTTSVSQSDTTISNNYPRGRYLPGLVVVSDNGNSDSDAFQRNVENNNQPPRDRQRKKLFTRMKSASTSRLNTGDNYKDRPCTPVENLRRQLEKLEDLEDQFPDNTLDATYHLRYPFSDVSNEHGGGNSSELEFFKHRIHLERDSVRRAKESLRTQRTNFRARQREIKQRHKLPAHPPPRASIDQLIQEEKDLTEMEVNLHRTRALLGEKVIRLRHLEQSLQRIYEKEKPMELLQVESKDDAATLSDLSSHSSSGFSSTDFASGDTHNLARRKDMYQESSECIQNLEILNAEIREILDILGKPQASATQPQQSDLNWTNLLSLSPPTFHHTSLAPPTAAVVSQPQPIQPSIPTLADRLETYRQLAAGRVQTSVGGAMLAANTIVSQNPRAVNYTTSLVERTRDLRNWLRQAKNEHEILSNLGAAIGNNPNTGQQANL